MSIFPPFSDCWVTTDLFAYCCISIVLYCIVPFPFLLILMVVFYPAFCAWIFCVLFRYLVVESWVMVQMCYVAGHSQWKIEYIHISKDRNMGLFVTVLDSQVLIKELKLQNRTVINISGSICWFISVNIDYFPLHTGNGVQFFRFSCPRAYLKKVICCVFFRGFSLL